MRPGHRLRLAISWPVLLAASALGYLGWWNFVRIPSLDGAAVSGQIFEVMNPDVRADQWQLQPIPDIEVLVAWFGEKLDNPVDSTTVCLRARRIRTDANGTFSAAAWSQEPPSVRTIVTEGVAYPATRGWTAVFPVADGPPPPDTRSTHRWFLRRAPADGQTTFMDAAGIARMQGCPPVE
jgi:hypothetical protein